MCILLLLQPEQDGKSPLSQQQPAYRPPVRNPFKAPGKKDKDAERRDEEARPPAEGHKPSQKENVAIAEKELDPKSQLSVTFRGKHLPPGMKLKKKVSNEEKNSPKGKSVGNLEREERSISTDSSVSENTQDLQKDSDLKKPIDDKASIKPSDSTVVKTLEESSSGCTQASTGSRSHPSNQCQNDGDDVVLVSVKPAAQTSPATAVQQPLTAFPGFQPASKVKSADDPRGLRGLFTAQLQQVKVSVKDWPRPAAYPYPFFILFSL